MRGIRQRNNAGLPHAHRALPNGAILIETATRESEQHEGRALTPSIGEGKRKRAIRGARRTDGARSNGDGLTSWTGPVRGGGWNSRCWSASRDPCPRPRGGAEEEGFAGGEHRYTDDPAEAVGLVQPGAPRGRGGGERARADDDGGDQRSERRGCGDARTTSCSITRTGFTLFNVLRTPASAC